ncbi:MAG: hypothetical protein ACRDRM_10765 [Pseudonocardiaceae bacterium]
MDRLDRKDLKDAPFDVVLRGYDKRQVDERLRFLSGELAAAEHALRATQSRAASLENELSHVRSGSGGARTGATGPGPGEAVADNSFGARVEKILMMAEEEAREVRNQADAEAAALVERARSEADELGKRAAQETASRQAEAEKASAAAAYESDQLRKTAAQEAEKLRRNAAQEAEEVRKVARAQAAQLVEQARVEADRLVGSATESAQHRERASAQELQRLSRLRDQVNAELYRAKNVLDSFFPAASGPPGPAKAGENGVVEQDDQSSRR